ncbi:MAG TPA: DUF1801 domain-containing protein [Vicinamibacteria bacterium]|nr:DUF1801 domain-containing protein [Vicinamibacteria bacterium]
MVRSAATTVAQYLESLPADRRAVVATVRALIRKKLPRGYEETMNWGVICYELPLSRYPDTYNGQPLACVALAAQKNHFAIYLWAAYGDPASRTALVEGFKKAGKKLDMGKGCVRFRRLDDLAPEAIGRAISRSSPARLIAQYEASRAGSSRRKR